MSTITATVLTALGIVRLDIDFSDISAPYVYVTRVDELTGDVTAVRTHGTAGSAGGLYYQGIQAGFKGVMFDTEVPTDRPVHYAASAVPWQRLVNGTFDGGSYPPWTATNSAVLFVGPATISATPGSADASALFIGNGGSANPGALSEPFLVTVGTPLTVTATALYAVTAGVTQTPTLLVNWYTSALALISTSTVATGSLAPGQMATITGTTAGAPATTAFARVELRDAAGTGNNIYWWNVTATGPAGSASSASVLVANTGRMWLRDPQRPWRDTPLSLQPPGAPGCSPLEGVVFLGLGSNTYANRSGRIDIASQQATVTTSRPRGLANTTLTLLAKTFADQERLLDLLAPGSPLLLQLPPEYGSPNLYLSVDSATVDRLLPDMRQPMRVFTLPAIVEMAPGGPGQGVALSRWADLCPTTWGAAKAAPYTWLQVTQGAAGGP